MVVVLVIVPVAPRSAATTASPISRVPTLFVPSLQMSAVRHVLASGLRTADIWSDGTTRVGTRAMGDAVVAADKTITKTKS